MTRRPLACHAIFLSLLPCSEAVVEELTQTKWALFNMQVTTIIGIVFATLLIAVAVVMQFRTMEAKSRFTLFLCIPGIVVPLIAYSYEQERVMQTPYLSKTTGDQEFFLRSWTPILVFFNRFGATLFALAMLIYKGESMGRRAPIMNYLMVAISNVVATLCQYVALKFITFQMQSLFKCTKIIWVMAWGYVMSGRKYDYITALVVTAGALLFGLAGNIETKYDAELGVSSKWGIFLMIGYLIADGLTSTMQEKIFRGYKLTPFNQMLYVNLLSSILAALLIAAKGSMVFNFIGFVRRHPECMYDIFLLVVSQITAQNFIYMMIANFGALLYATIMYARQLLSITFNTLWFEDDMTTLQWVAVLIVFGALFSKSEFVRRVIASRLPCFRRRSSTGGETTADVELMASEKATKA